MRQNKMNKNSSWLNLQTPATTRLIEYLARSNNFTAEQKKNLHSTRHARWPQNFEASRIFALLYLFAFCVLVWFGESRRKEGGGTKTKAFWFSVFWSKSVYASELERASEQTKHRERLQERAVEQSVGQGSRADCIPCRISGARTATPRARYFIPSTTRGIPIPLPPKILPLQHKPDAFSVQHF